MVKLAFAIALAATGATSHYASAASAHVVSGTTNRLPMGLSTVIADLEAEGAARVTTAAFLASRSVRGATRARLLRSLFGVSGSGDHDGEVTYGSTTAFGKKLAGEGTAGDSAAGGGDGDGSEEEESGSGVAVACPAASASASEVASTVVACGGTVVYVADNVDLGRGEGLFDTLGPAVERLLNSSPRSRSSTLVVVVDGASSDVAGARTKFEAAAARMLSAIVQPSAKRAESLGDVFDRIEYLPSTDADVDVHLCPAGGRVGHPASPSARDPTEIAGSVAGVVAAGLVENPGPVVEMASKVPVKRECPRLTNPVDLAAARMLGPAAGKALDGCLAYVAGIAAGAEPEGVVPDFGDLCDAAVERALSTFDEAAGGGKSSPGGLLRRSPVARRIRSDLLENLYAELSEPYDAQVTALKSSSFDSYRARLNKIRISPLLASDMKAAADETLAEFSAAARRLKSKGAPASSLWTSTADHANGVRRKMTVHGSDRLRAAKASGQFKPIPRKGVTLGFHWLLPKPFGNDYRQEPWDARTADDLVFVPRDGLTDVSPSGVRTGDWRKAIVPAPSGSEMMYLK